jgi:type IV secretory pathway ATPase VirB11/archaellum biosynthesis ATPase
MAAATLLHAWYEALFARIMAHQDTEEIAINRFPKDETEEDTTFFLRKRTTGQWHEYRLPPVNGQSMTQRDLELFAQIVSNILGQTYDPKSSPFLFETMPDGARLTVVTGGATRWQVNDSTGGILLLRQGSQARLHNTPLDLIPVPAPEKDVETAIHALPLAGQDAVRQCLTDGRGLLIAGEPASGKTTFLKQYLRCLPPEYRYAVLEDTREIEPWGPRNIAYLFNARGQEDGWTPIANTLQRSTVNVAIFGELNPILANALQRMGRLGLRHTAATTHEADAVSAIKGLFSLMRSTGIGEEEFLEFFERLFTAVVVMEKDDRSAKRFISEIVYTEDIFKSARELSDLKGNGKRLPNRHLRLPADAPLLTQGINP